MAEGAEGLTAVKSKRKRFSKRLPDGPFGAHRSVVSRTLGFREHDAVSQAVAEPGSAGKAERSFCMTLIELTRPKSRAGLTLKPDANNC